MRGEAVEREILIAAPPESVFRCWAFYLTQLADAAGERGGAADQKANIAG